MFITDRAGSGGGGGGGRPELRSEDWFCRGRGRKRFPYRSFILMGPPRPMGHKILLGNWSLRGSRNYRKRTLGIPSRARGSLVIALQE